MAYKITGRVTVVGPLQTLTARSGNTYTKRDLVMTVRKFDPYTGQPADDPGNTPKFTFMGDKCRQLDRIKPDDVVVIHFDISGRSYDKDGKTEYFTEVRPFRVDLQPTANSRITQEAYQENTSAQPEWYAPGYASYPAPFGTQPPPQAPGASPDDDDLPF